METEAESRWTMLLGLIFGRSSGIGYICEAKQSHYAATSFSPYLPLSRRPLLHFAGDDQGKGRRKKTMADSPPFRYSCSLSRCLSHLLACPLEDRFDDDALGGRVSFPH